MIKDWGFIDKSDDQGLGGFIDKSNDQGLGGL